MATLQDLQELFAERKPIDVAMEISGFTGFRTTHIEDLSAEEINTLYAVHFPTEQSVEAEFNAFKAELVQKAWRSKILAAAEQAGLKEAGSYHQFNNWMMSKSKYKKPLFSHTVGEMKELHRQLKAALTNNRRSAEKPMTEAWWKKGKSLIIQN